ncbi:hypothetical protein BLNAU_16153 [Blattamonas nauphoetae]|uniref:PH domain-containing protein n=1 Tax=Blattamonas nauphoetae TaxID=2049346 RepID=A0ABQ9XC65_9EUKA|nr:hypothetical protein BLNAU_16153 [Blattamonas nauphoetae]
MLDEQQQQAQIASVGTHINPSDAMEKMHKGSLILKQESNGLHLRWLCLNSTATYLYWLNPKKDILKIEEDTMVQINSITRIVISADALALSDSQNDKDVLGLSALSFSFSIYYGQSQLDIFCPIKQEFEVWICGLRALVGESRVFQAQIQEGQRFRSLEDVDFLRTRILELIELTDSLMKEVAIMMEIRAKRDRVTQYLLDQSNQASKSANTAYSNETDSIISNMKRVIAKQDAQIKELQRQSVDRTDKAEISLLERQIEGKSEIIAELQKQLADLRSYQQRPQTPLRSHRGGRGRSSSSRRYAYDDDDLEYEPYSGGAIAVRGRHITTPILRQRELKMEGDYMREKAREEARELERPRTRRRPATPQEPEAVTYNSLRHHLDSLLKKRDALRRELGMDSADEESSEDSESSIINRAERLKQVDEILDMVDDLEDASGDLFSQEQSFQLFRQLQQRYYPNLDNYSQLQRDLLVDMPQKRAAPQHVRRRDRAPPPALAPLLARAQLLVHAHQLSDKCRIVSRHRPRGESHLVTSLPRRDMNDIAHRRVNHMEDHEM